MSQTDKNKFKFNDPILFLLYWGHKAIYKHSSKYANNILNILCDSK